MRTVSVRKTFLSTLSLRRATAKVRHMHFLSTLSLRRATFYISNPLKATKFSIHALLAESDAPPYNLMIHQKIFYPRSPCGERLILTALLIQPINFLSTLSLRRATARRASRQQPAGFSIHALLAESDLCAFVSLFGVFLFLSTLSLRRATIVKGFCSSGIKFSIHALLAESDKGFSFLPIG